MEIIEEMQNDINIYRLQGQLDTNASREFEQRLFKAITSGAKNLVLNFAGLHYISSAGIRVILKAINAIKRIDGRIMLCCMQDYVRVMRGPMRNAVSMGLYSKLESAERRMAELRSKGYEPAMHTRYEEQRVQWLDVTFRGPPGLPGDAFRAEFPSRRLSRVDCE